MIPNFTLNNGLEIPCTGLGTFRIPNGEEAARVIREAVEAGYRSFDTAMVYMNEEGIGAGVRTCGIPREEVHVTTKLWNDAHGYEQALKAFDASLKRLNLDYIDEYLIHWPGTEATFIPTWRAMEKLYREGYIKKAIGICNFLKPALSLLLQTCAIKPMIHQLEIHPTFQPNDLIRFNKFHDIQTEAWRPILWGKLDQEPLLTIAEKYGKTAVQVVLRWHYQKGIRSLPKTAHKERLAENLNSYDFELTQEELARIDALQTYCRTGESPDEFFYQGTVS
jgi:diketogulonate reductase-like aldo/keto reductase